MGYIEGNLSPEIATAVATIGGLGVALQLYILNK